MTKLSLSKHHGLGNDFLVAFDPVPGDARELSRRLCDRRRGVGADGLLIVGDAPGYDARMVLYNADGSRAEMSGNGIRCFAQALAARRGRLDDLVVLTDAGERRVRMRPGDDPATVEATVEMGDVVLLEEPPGWQQLGCHPDRPVAHLGLGNPHSVVGVDDVSVVDLVELGGKVPAVNLEIVEPGPEPDAITMRVHERGVGVTEACGTGACAAAYAARSWGLVAGAERAVVVHMVGGSGTVTFDPDLPGRVELTGPATFVATIEVEVP